MDTPVEDLATVADDVDLNLALLDDLIVSDRQIAGLTRCARRSASRENL
jgi:hypothetical protein